MARFPFFVLIGDSFLCEEKRKEIVRLLEKEFGPLAVSVSRAEETSVASLLSEARTLPFLASAQVFCVRKAEEISKNDLELWKSYLKSPTPRSFFIFEAESLERNHPLLQIAQGARQAFFLKNEEGRIQADFIRRKLHFFRKRISQEALELLEARVGDSWVFLDSILNHLVLAVGEKEEIDRTAIENFEEKWPQWEGGDLMEALAEKNISRALEILHELLAINGQELPSLLGLLHWQFRRFWQAKKWLNLGISEREISARLKLWSSEAGVFFKRLRRFSLKELERVIEGLFVLDWQIKTGRAEGRYEMEAWLVGNLAGGV